VPRTFLIDTDTASDDAVALIMALRAPDVRVAAITMVAGNVNVRQATRNALYAIELCAAEVPVYVGAKKPLLRAYTSATWFHGRDGFGGHDYPTPGRLPEKVHAVDAIITTIEANPGLVLVTLGPLTNIAVALARKPSIATKISRCVVMGGAPCCEGNVTPAAEYNVWVDPEAARIVMRSGLPVELIGWQLSRGEAVVNETDMELMQGFDTELARFAIECNSHAPRLQGANRRRRNLSAGSSCDVHCSRSECGNGVERALCGCRDSKRIDARDDGRGSFECGRG